MSLPTLSSRARSLKYAACLFNYLASHSRKYTILQYFTCPPLLYGDGELEELSSSESERKPESAEVAVAAVIIVSSSSSFTFFMATSVRGGASTSEASGSGCTRFCCPAHPSFKATGGEHVNAILTISSIPLHVSEGSIAGRLVVPLSQVNNAVDRNNKGVNKVDSSQSYHSAQHARGQLL